MKFADSGLTLYQNLINVASIRKNETAIFYEQAKISYSSFIIMVERMSQAILDAGIKKGDTITILSPNIPEAVAAFYASSQLGLKVSLLHPLSKVEKIQDEIKAKNSKLLIVASILLANIPGILDTGFKIMALEVKSSLPFFKKAFYPLVSKNDRFPFKDHKEVIRFSNSGKRHQEVENYDSKDGRLFLSSGGTSGKEKSIILSDYAFLSLIADIPMMVEPKERRLSDVCCLAALPMFHGFGLTIAILGATLWGASIELLPKFRTKKALMALKHRGRYGVFLGVPVMFEAILRNPKFTDKLAKNLYVSFVGGDFVSPSLLKRFNEKMEKAGSEGRLFEGYGLTETVTVLAVNRYSAFKEGTVGKAVDGVKAVVIDESGKVLPPNAEGELAIVGNTLMNGYLEGEDPWIDIEGKRYIKSGDIGKIDEEGYITFISRKKRVIKQKGFNIYPLAIEKRVSSVPGVNMSAFYSKVVDGNEVTYLDLVLDKGIDPEDIKKEVEKILKNEFNPYEFPAHLNVRKALPQTNVGKIDYKVLEKE